MKKWLLLGAIAALTACDGQNQESGASRVEAQGKSQDTLELTITMGIHNFAPAPLSGVNVEVFLPMSVSGMQSVRLLSDKNGTLTTLDGSPAVLTIPVGDMPARASEEKSITLEIGYRTPLPLAEFEALEAPDNPAEKGEDNTAVEGQLVEPEQPEFSELAAMHSPGPVGADPLVKQEEQLSEEDRQWLDEVTALQQKGNKVYVFEGIVCQQHKPCRLLDKTVWYDMEASKEAPKEASDHSADQVRLVYQNLTTMEQVRQALANKKHMALSSAAVELK